MFGAIANHPPSWRQHICGLYYSVPCQGRLEKCYLPQVELEAHATILSTTSRTTLTQKFSNPSTEKGIKEAKYTFPLYDGVSVVGFTCLVGDRTIVGVVKEKEKAKSDFTEAVSRGETAGLFEQLDTADVFSTTVGNVPPGTNVVIKITYLGELKHDMEVDGIRFIIPNIIAPRYGRIPQALYSNTAQNAVGSSISITVDAEMAEGSSIQKILSPSHPIAVSMGTTSLAPNAEPTMAKASATLSLGSSQLNNDFVLQIVAKDTGVPKAILETHPMIPNQRALMATLVPRFALPPEKPEVVFVCDRSGSMSGRNISLAKQALQVFLKSLPVGVMFNICSFGSNYSFLWPKSMPYNQATLDEAVSHVNTIDANYGGTEMLAPLTATIEQRYRDIPLEIMFLTDGEIWSQQQLFAYLNEQVSEKKQQIRVFTLGVGAAVSHSLIEGVARAGNGFSQTVAGGEKMDAKVVRMLKGALSPHISDYTLEVKYAAVMTPTSDDDDGDYEFVQKVADSLKIKLDLNDKEEATKPTKPISLFDTSANPDEEPAPAHDETGESRYAHVPKLRNPNIIQAPQNITTLFAFNRTTVYLLFGPNTPHQLPKSVVLRGTSTHGPLELEFPIQVLDTPGEMIHQLAAKNAIAELEQGRGWLPEARNEAGELVKERFESRFSSMVEREAVRLGVQFQVGGKWCSFVAVEKDQKTADEQDKEKEKEGWEWLEDEEILPSPPQPVKNAPRVESGFSPSSGPTATGSYLFTNQIPTSALQPGIPLNAPQDGNDVSLPFIGCSYKCFGQSPSPPTNVPGLPQAPRNPFVSLFGSASSGPSVPTGISPFAQNNSARGLFGNTSGAANTPPSGSLFGSAAGGHNASAPAMLPSGPTRVSPFAQNSSSGGLFANLSSAANAPASGSLFGSAAGGCNASASAMLPSGSTRVSPFAQNSSSGGLFANISSATNAPASGSLFGSAVGESSVPSLTSSSTGALLFGGAGVFGSAAPINAFGSFSTGTEGGLFGVTGGLENARSALGSTPPSTRTGSALFGAPNVTHAPTLKSADEDTLTFLIEKQAFTGNWSWETSIFTAIRVSESSAMYEGINVARFPKAEWATALVAAFLGERLARWKGSWELVVEKARGWLEGSVGDAKMGEMLEKAKALV